SRAHTSPSGMRVGGNFLSACELPGSGNSAATTSPTCTSTEVASGSRLRRASRFVEVVLPWAHGWVEPPAGGAAPGLDGATDAAAPVLRGPVEAAPDRLSDPHAPRPKLRAPTSSAVTNGVVLICT